MALSPRHGTTPPHSLTGTGNSSRGGIRYVSSRGGEEACCAVCFCPGAGSVGREIGGLVNVMNGSERLLCV